MNKTQIHQALSTYIGSLTDPEIKQILVRGGWIGLSRDADLQDFDFSDFQLLVGLDNWGAAREVFVSGCVFELDAQQGFDADDLLPVAEEDDEGVTPDRITEKAVARAREQLMGGLNNGWVDQIDAAISEG